MAHNLAQASAAAAAAEACAAALSIRTPPNAGRSLGVAGWLAIAEAARASAPGASVTFCLDCGEFPGDAYAAIKLGAERVALAEMPARARIGAIAASAGAVLEDGPADFDLAFIHDPQTAVCRLLNEDV